MGKYQSSNQGIFQSAEHSAMYDIYTELSNKAKVLISLTKKDRKADKEIYKKRSAAWKPGGNVNERELSYTSDHYRKAYWYSSIVEVSEKLFVGKKHLATKKNRQLNRELGLHKINMARK